MDILPEIVNRHSVRKYTKKPVTDEQVRLLLEAARLAPSGSNKQPWDFLVVRSDVMKKRICEVDHNQKWMLTAPVFLICIGNERYRGDGDMDRVIRDSAIAATHILLQAEHMGLSTCWTGWYEQEAIRSTLDLDDHCYVIGVITVGYADEFRRATKRRNLAYKVL